MRKTLHFLLITAAFGHTIFSADPPRDEHLTNAPARVAIGELLEHRDAWNSNRVEVVGYYRYFFEYSVLTPAERARPDTGIWVDPLRVAPNGIGRIGQVSNEFVRVIGTFRVYRGHGAGHNRICPAEITNLELLERAEKSRPMNIDGVRPRKDRGAEAPGSGVRQ